MKILHFAPLPWDELQKNGYRKTSGAMFKALRVRDDVEHIWYIQHDRRWGVKLITQAVDKKLTVVGLPIGLPYERFSPFRSINRNLQAALLQRTVLTGLDLTQALYWFYDWWNIELISRLPKARTVMEVTDRAGHFVSSASTDEKRLVQIQQEARQRVDYFFSSVRGSCRRMLRRIRSSDGPSKRYWKRISGASK